MWNIDRLQDTYGFGPRMYLRDLKMRAGYDFSQAIRAIEDDIEVIDAGLERLNKPDG